MCKWAGGTETDVHLNFRRRCSLGSDWSLEYYKGSRMSIQVTSEGKTLGTLKDITLRNCSSERMYPKSQELLPGNVPTHVEKQIFIAGRND